MSATLLARLEQLLKDQGELCSRIDEIGKRIDQFEAELANLEKEGK